jgi:hypothetical protein
MSFTRLTETGLSYRELAKIIGLSHMVVHGAVQGRKLRNLNMERMSAATKVLVGLVDTGKLPMKTDDKFKRASNIEKLVAYVATKIAA